VLAIVIATKERRMEDLERLLGEHGGELDLSDCAPVWRHADVERFDENDIATIPNALHNNATVTDLQLPGVWSAGYAIGEPLLEMMQHNTCITFIYADCDDCGPNDVMEQVFHMCTVRIPARFNPRVFLIFLRRVLIVV
jgi:hypothetical protein